MGPANKYDEKIINKQKQKLYLIRKRYQSVVEIIILIEYKFIH